ncbi:MAG: hypothetical protein ABL308_06140 [Oceanicaulis sp.]
MATFACAPDEETRALRAKDEPCAPWRGDPERLADDFGRFDVGAIDCVIASYRYNAIVTPEIYDAERGFDLGIRRWWATGEPNALALDYARGRPRDAVFHHSLYWLQIFEGHPEVQYDAEGCMIVDEIMLELLRVAEPDALTASCAEAWGLDAQIMVLDAE